jgi:hypothetical protein
MQQCPHHPGGAVAAKPRNLQGEEERTKPVTALVLPSIAMTGEHEQPFRPGDAVEYHHDQRTTLRATVLRAPSRLSVRERARTSESVNNQDCCRTIVRDVQRDHHVFLRRGSATAPPRKPTARRAGVGFRKPA